MITTVCQTKKNCVLYLQAITLKCFSYRSHVQEWSLLTVHEFRIDTATLMSALQHQKFREQNQIIIYHYYYYYFAFSALTLLVWHQGQLRDVAYC